MSQAEDTELRDLICQTLEKKGILSKIRAELRASVFLALEEQSSEPKQLFVNNVFSEYLARSDSILSLCLVRELLEYLELNSTLAVFNSETHHGKDYEYKGRDMLMKDLHLEKFKDCQCPLLSLVLQNAQESLHSNNSPLKQKEEAAGDFDAPNVRSPKASMPPNLSFAESSISSVDNSCNPFNQTFTTGALVTSFSSPDNSLEKQTPEGDFQIFQNKNQVLNEKKPHLAFSSNKSPSEFKAAGESAESKYGGEVSNSTQSSKEKAVLTPSTNPQTSLSNLPPLTGSRTSKIQGSDQESLLNALMSTDLQDNYEEDFSSESSGVGDKEERLKTGKIEGKKPVDMSQVSSKDMNSPAASVSEELEGETNSGTEDVLNSAASVDTLDSSLSYVDLKNADYMENV